MLFSRFESLNQAFRMLFAREPTILEWLHKCCSTVMWCMHPCIMEDGLARWHRLQRLRYSMLRITRWSRQFQIGENIFWSIFCTFGLHKTAKADSHLLTTNLRRQKKLKHLQKKHAICCPFLLSINLLRAWLRALEGRCNKKSCLIFHEHTQWTTISNHYHLVESCSQNLMACFVH